MTGRVCPKHEEWCPTGECRWCAPEPESKVVTAPKTPLAAWVPWSNAHSTPPSVLHYPACPLKGVMDPDPAKDLAAGCTCVPFP